MSGTSKFSFNLGLNLSTALRATEAFQPEGQQIFDAEFDYSLLPTLYRGLLVPGFRKLVLVLLEKSGMGTPGMLFCRTRFIDDALTDWLRTGKQQVVCMGAGNDTRGYRIPGIEHTHYYEVDLPIPQMLKREHMKKVLGEIPANVSYVAVDFEDQDLDLELKKAGFRSDVQTFFIWEGVTQYISEEAVTAVMGLAAQAPTGSQLAFTYIKVGIIDGTSRSEVDQRIMNRVAKRGMPWLFGLEQEQLDVWLGKQGFYLIDQAGADEYRQRYLTPVGRELSIYRGERIALAGVQNVG